MIKIMIFFGVLMLASCVQRQVVWDKYGATQNQFAQDQFACEKASQITIPGRPYQAPPSQMVSGQYVAPSWSQQLNAVVASNPSVRMDEGAFVNCMQSKGYQGRYK
jgi:hypothetical protein